jgi:hypothetical protein
MDFSSFSSDVLATVIGGLVLALLFFLAKEHMFPIPNVTGRWYFTQQTEHTAYHPYAGMALQYVAMLWLEGNLVHGSVEKTHEKSSTGERSFVGHNRTRGILQGYVQKNYLKRDRLFIHVIEDGHGRESTNFYDLTAEPDGTLIGSFQSMVADQNGSVKWQRDSF